MSLDKRLLAQWLLNVGEQGTGVVWERHGAKSRYPPGNHHAGHF